MTGCGEKKEVSTDVKYVTSENDKKALIEVIKSFDKLYFSKDITSLQKYLPDSNKVHFFGSDSNEIINNKESFWEHVRNSWNKYKFEKIGEPQNLSIEIDKSSVLAAALYEVPTDINYDGKELRKLFRFSETWKKENNDWKLAGGIIAVVTPQESSYEMPKNKLKSK